MPSRRSYAPNCPFDGDGAPGTTVNVRRLSRASFVSMRVSTTGMRGRSRLCRTRTNATPRSPTDTRVSGMTYGPGPKS